MPRYGIEPYLAAAWPTNTQLYDDRNALQGGALINMLHLFIIEDLQEKIRKLYNT